MVVGMTSKRWQTRVLRKRFYAVHTRSLKLQIAIVVGLLASLLTLGVSWVRTQGVAPQRARMINGTISSSVAQPIASGAKSSVENSSHSDGLISYADLPELSLFNVNTKQTGRLRLYDRNGYVDVAQARLAEESMADTRRKGKPVTRTIERRLLQILVRSAYHFRKRELEIVSGYRKPMRRREGYHALGRAVDYRILGVDAAELASYLRRIPKLGVGVYTHPKTQFVHLDVREESYHWLDASPPRRRWKERSLGGRTLALLDRQYRRADDWPEGFAPPSDEEQRERIDGDSR